MNKYILELAVKANALSNRYRDAVENDTDLLVVANALAAVVDELVSAIADEAS